MISQVLGATSGGFQPNWYTFNSAMIMCGFSSEYLKDNRVFTVKHMYPSPSFFHMETKCSAAIVNIRDPLDFYRSIIQTAATCTQNKNMKNSLSQEFRSEFFAEFENIMRTWNKIFTFWINEAKQAKYPLYFVKYEEICANKAKILTEMVSFSLGVESIEGTLAEARIERQVGSAKVVVGKTYDRRKEAGEDVALLTQEHYELVAKECAAPLIYFGYAKTEENPSGKYVVPATPEEVKANFNYYKEVNKASIKMYAENKDQIDLTYQDFGCENAPVKESVLTPLVRQFLPKYHTIDIVQ
mmetsp:Transcript_8779/g.8112  ORF Transcript_8779/g.8112 Transcript_8779/m.8112 type:complete len:299 (-) Transcript_8779:46-942(-)